MIDSNYGSIAENAAESIETRSPPARKHLSFCGKEIKMTKSELICAILLSSFFLLNWTYFAIFPTVLPHEAMKKGMTQTQVGFIFGIFQLVLFLLYPVFGKYLNRIGVRFLFVSGVLLASTGAIGFAFLDRSPAGITYFLMSLFCRTVTGLGASMGISYAIVAYSFPNNVASVVAVLEFVSGIGFMAGPVIGGALFQLGGFELPFLTIGGLMFLLFIVSFFFFPDSEGSAMETSPNEPSALPILPLLKIPQFSLTLMIMFIACLGINFLEPTLQIHLLPLELMPYQLGFVFFVPAFTYTLVTPLVGFVCEKFPGIMPYLMMGSSCLSIIAYSILGPLPFVEIPLNLPIFLIGYILFAIAYTGNMVPVYSELSKISIKHGYPNDLRTQGLISGIFSATHSLAAFIGPMLGGFSVQYIGYRNSVFAIIIMFLVAGSSYAVVYFKTENNDDDENENSPILNSESRENQ